MCRSRHGCCSIRPKATGSTRTIPNARSRAGGRRPPGRRARGCASIASGSTSSSRARSPRGRFAASAGRSSRCCAGDGRGRRCRRPSAPTRRWWVRSARAGAASRPITFRSFSTSAGPAPRCSAVRSVWSTSQSTPRSSCSTRATSGGRVRGPTSPRRPASRSASPAAASTWTTRTRRGASSPGSGSPKTCAMRATTRRTSTCSRSRAASSRAFSSASRRSTRTVRQPRFPCARSGVQ